MAKSSFLTLCQTVRRESGVSGSGPAAVTGQTGILEKIVNWVADADKDIQGLWQDWDFLHITTWAENTIAGVATVSAPSDIGVWDEESFYLDRSTTDYKHLSVLAYRDWRRDYRNGVKTNNKPDSVVIKPDLSLVLESPPDAIYSLTADYWKRPAKMTANADTSPIPEEFERIIIAGALVRYAIDQGAPAILSAAQIEFDSLLDQLEAKYLPGQKARRRGEAPCMVVVPE